MKSLTSLLAEREPLGSRGTGAFSEGLARVVIEGKNGYINPEGVLTIPTRFDRVKAFSEGLAAVLIDDRWGYINQRGEFVIDPRFDDAYPFDAGSAFVKVDDTYGLIDRTGRFLAPPVFTHWQAFREGLAAVRLSDKWGFLSREGKMVISPQFDLVPTVGSRTSIWGTFSSRGWSGFQGGTAIVRMGTPQVVMEDGQVRTVGVRYGTINTEGEYVIEPQFESMDPPIEQYGLRYYSSYFQPYAVAGDFDGNGQEDYAVRIVPHSNGSRVRYANQAEIVVLLSQGAALTPHALGKGEYVTVVKAGTQVSDFTGEASITLSNDALSSGYLE